MARRGGTTKVPLFLPVPTRETPLRRDVRRAQRKVEDLETQLEDAQGRIAFLEARLREYLKESRP
jgi:TolA-binding protein